LSKDALAGTVPLRTFGQLKQLWEAKVEPAPTTSGGPAEAPTSSPVADTVQRHHPAVQPPASADAQAPPPTENDTQPASGSV
jgi:uncharacterized protein